MDDVVLVKFEPTQDTHNFAPPFGILYLADSLEKAGFSVELVHESGNNANIQKLVGLIEEKKPLFVGFSCFTSSALTPTIKASVEVKKRSKTPVVWGGVHATILPEQTLRNDYIDIIGIGEGEETIVELANLIGNKGLSPDGLAGIKGIGFKKNENLIVNEARPFIQDLDQYSPAWHLLGLENYIYTKQHFYTQVGSKMASEKIAALITSRGCPWRCGYCYNQAVNRRTFRVQSVEKVMREVDKLKEYGASAVIFEDDNLFGNKNRALEIIGKINMNWSSTIRADCIAKWGDGFVRELSENGCSELRIGAESGSHNVLNIMKKDITVGQIKEAVQLCSRVKIRSLLNFMIGVPGESWSDVCQTLDLLDEFKKVNQYISVGSPGIYLPFPQTGLYTEAVNMGFNPPDSTEGWAKDWGQKWKLAPYADKRIRYIGFYWSIIRRDFTNVSFPFFARLLRQIALLRWKKRYFRFALDYHVPAFFLRLIRKLGLRKISKAIYQ
jgi:radical SAM superfamily enzyme YgiQ (UPF0313 family)